MRELLHWLRVRLRWLALAQLRGSERCLKEAAQLKADGLAGCIAHQYALMGGYIYLLRAELLGLDKNQAEQQRALLKLME